MKTRVTHKRIFDSPDQMMDAVNSYFEEADNASMPYTISGLCLAIGFSREMLLRSSYDSTIGDIVNQAKLLIEQQHEILLLTDHRKSSGIIFALKNLGWSDQRYIDIGIGGSAAPGEKEQLKWTVEVIAPGEAGNDNKAKHKIKPSEIEYFPPVDSTAPPVASNPESDSETVETATEVEGPAPEKDPVEKQTLSEFMSLDKFKAGASFSFARSPGDMKTKAGSQDAESEALREYAKAHGLTFQVEDGKVYPRYSDPSLNPHVTAIEVPLKVEKL